jgi:hypothetical protein
MVNGKKLSGILCASALLLLLCACTGPGRFVYPPEKPELVSFDTAIFPGRSVRVNTFRDMRGQLFDTDSFYMYMIPLMPYGYIQYDRPEQAEMMMTVEKFNFAPAVELARAAAYSLKHSGAFADVLMSAGSGTKTDADYEFNGIIISTRYTGKPFSYGLMSAGPFLWMVGLPAGNAVNRLTLYFSLSEASGKLIWDFAYSGDEYTLLWLYGNAGKGVRMYSRLMATAMNLALEDMRARLFNKR